MLLRKRSPFNGRLALILYWLGGFYTDWFKNCALDNKIAKKLLSAPENAL
ncbi:hypothetical protein XCR1_950043 [Xenorhabdus cabanillasii JM26]|uniref:Uncharacterized protein n=1 Tax=Xenorhabdus cabanillasii JM26 TaxID=1427517 RepID=W1JCU8_9GAMM|nr:hypothetical protein XCR1_950043 [Xenorhabdus cabanillasii JM26]